MTKPVWVLDTNIVLDLFHFDEPAARMLLEALREGRARCVANPATLDELRRVLGYPEFKLGAADQAALFTSYSALVEHAQVSPRARSLPTCRDPDDQKFLELAEAYGADLVISRDRALLKLHRRCLPRFGVRDAVSVARALVAPEA